MPLREALSVWLLVAAQSYGGPAGQIAVMHRIVVEERRWLGEERFLHALNYCMLLPGPEAQQLITYLGWLSHGLRGGLIAGSLFVLPGFVAILFISALYVRFQGLPAADAALLGLKAAVLAVVLEAMIRIGRRVATTLPSQTLALAAFCALYLFHVPFPAVIATAALLGASLPKLFPPPVPPKPSGSASSEPLLDPLIERDALPHIRPDTARDLAVAACILVAWLAPTVLCWALLGGDSTFTRIGRFFSSAAVVTFGGAYSVLAYVGQQAVEVHGWLSATEMLDGLGFAETTPGPLIQVVQFVGFLAAWRDPGPLPAPLSALLGSLLTTWVTFAPSFLWVLAGGPYIEQIRKVPALSSALRGITSAVVGVIGNLTLWLALRVWFEVMQVSSLAGLSVETPQLSSVRPSAVGITLLSALLLLWFKIPMTPVLLLGTMLGLCSWMLL